MVAYSFKARFADAVADGRKTQTIRAPRKRHARPGETLQLYTGMRTKQCRKLREVVCDSVRAIDLDFSANTITIEGIGVLSNPAALDHIATKDGFANWAEMKTFWPDATHFSGVLILWDQTAPHVSPEAPKE